MFAQQGTPSGEGPRVVPPQATPIVQIPTRQPVIPVVPDRPETWIPATPPYTPPSLPQLNNGLPTSASILIANIPAELLPVAEPKAVAAAPGAAAIVSMNAATASPELRPVAEAKAVAGPVPSSMTVDTQNPPVPEIKSLPSFAMPGTAAVQMNVPSADVMPVPEPR